MNIYMNTYKGQNIKEFTFKVAMNKAVNKKK